MDTPGFQGRNALAHDFLDDVSVTASAPDAGSSVLLFGLALMGLSFIRLALFGTTAGTIRKTPEEASAEN